ncbi:hypothetical protein [Coleofasciculus sp. E1-EBD-02]|uniref:hypothetical protein n=1 Tax=Coleofasciculus sp. E1-EBD-02 TaxID=3068481 RepID=UPI0032FDF9D0
MTNRVIAGCSYSRQFYRAHVNSPYGWTTNSAIACSIPVNSIVRSLSYSQQAPILFPPSTLPICLI